MSQLLNMQCLTLFQFQERRFCCGYKSSTGEYVTEELVVHVRPAMNWILEHVEDPDLCRIFKWYPVRKFLVEDGEETQMWDDIDCGSDWWDVQIYFVIH